MKKILLTLITLLLPLTSAVAWETWVGDLYLSGYTKYGSTDKIAWVNKCKATSSGAITVPAQVTIDNQTYNVVGISEPSLNRCFYG